MRVIILFCIALLTSCAQWFPANYNELSPGVYQIAATGNSFASLKKLQLKIDKKATALCAPLGYSYPKKANFKVHKQQTYVNGVMQTSHYIVYKQVAVCDGANITVDDELFSS